MNCIPSGKLISNKNKNKTLSIASQKYEQRIKAAKSRQGIQFIIPNDTNGKENHNDCEDNWSRKLTDIDNWRRGVVSAMSNGIEDNDSSNWKNDSSTLTSNTLLSVEEIYNQDNRQHHRHPELPRDANNLKITKSPSIPLFRTQAVDQHNLLQSNHVIGDREEFLERRMMSTDDDDDDDVFSASTCGNDACLPPCKMSPSPFIDYNPISLETYSKEMNYPYTPQMVKRPWHLPVLKKEIYPEYLSEKYLSPESINGRNISQKCYQHIVASETSKSQNQHDNWQNDYQNHNSKRNIHKNETNAVIILRNSCWNSTNDKQESHFQRSGSLSIKRLDTNRDKRIDLINNSNISLRSKDFPNNSCQSPQYLHETNRRQFYDENGALRRLSISNIIPSSKHYPFISLVPTGSQEHIASQPFQNEPRPNRLIKNNSLTNLGNQQNHILKVAINQPLTMRLAFVSEPNLAPTFVNIKPVKIFP